jgi:hypothetical protein
MFNDIFGFKFKESDKKRKEEEKKSPSFVIPTDDDGAVTVEGTGAYATYVDLDGAIRNEFELITRYRDMCLQPECDQAVDDIVNEALISDKNVSPVTINLEGVDKELLSDKIKEQIKEEFDKILLLLDFKDMSYDIFRKWYVDGKLFFHVMIDKDHPEQGIVELRYIDPRQIRKVREITYQKDVSSGIDLVDKINEYFVYNPRGWIVTGSAPPTSYDGVKISEDSIVYAHSGILDRRSKLVVSHLHKAIKALNQLRMIEDAVVIYRIARAPERRIFYIDVGNLPKTKAEEYMKQIMTKYKNKMVYDSSTGELRDDRKVMSMLEDFWLPRREGSQGTQIDTLPAGQNLSEMQDVEYFQKKLYRSLNVPVSRLEAGNGFNMGRSSEITRDELKFNKFIVRLQKRFAHLFSNILEKQLLMKQIVSRTEWEAAKEKIFYDFVADSYFTESKNSEIIRSRMDTLKAMGWNDNAVGVFYSKQFVRKSVLMLSDDDIAEMKKEIEQEKKEDEEKQKEEQEKLAKEQGEQEFGGEQEQDGETAKKPESINIGTKRNLSGFKKNPTDAK